MQNRVTLVPVSAASVDATLQSQNKLAHPHGLHYRPAWSRSSSPASLSKGCSGTGCEERASPKQARPVSRESLKPKPVGTSPRRAMPADTPFHPTARVGEA